MLANVETRPISGVTIEDAVHAFSNERGFACIDRRKSRTPDRRYSIVTALPRSTFILAGAFVTIDGHTTIETPSDALTRFLARASDIPKDPYLPFSGGAIGYISFEGAKAMKGFGPAEGFSRLPQCKFGLYEAFILFDHLEGTAKLVSSGPGREVAERMGDILFEERSSRPKVMAHEALAASARMVPDDAQFQRQVANAKEWLRSECVEVLNLVRHEESVVGTTAPLHATEWDMWDGTCALFTHEGAAMSFGATASLKKGYIRETIAMLPYEPLTGTPVAKAVQYIDANEPIHRQFLGGAFGWVSGNLAEFHPIESSTSFADGTIRRTIGFRMTAAAR